jgi:hypothetical protein
MKTNAAAKGGDYFLTWTKSNITATGLRSQQSLSWWENLPHLEDPASWLQPEPNNVVHILINYVLWSSLILSSSLSLPSSGFPTIPLKVKGKTIPCNRSSRLPHFLDTRFTNGGEVLSLTRRPPFTPVRFLALISVRRCVDLSAIVRLEG